MAMAMTKTQQKYAQIEKELLSVWFGYQRFHQYIFSQKITVESDHKPLIPILKKSTHQAPLRLQTLIL